VEGEGKVKRPTQRRQRKGGEKSEKNRITAETLRRRRTAREILRPANDKGAGLRMTVLLASSETQRTGRNPTRENPYDENVWQCVNLD
jgi:hypothetical protein